MLKENIHKIRNIVGATAILLADAACQMQVPNNTIIYTDINAGRSKHGVWTEVYIQVNKEVYLLNGEFAPGSNCTSGLLERGTDMGGATAFDSSKTRQLGKLC